MGNVSPPLHGHEARGIFISGCRSSTLHVRRSDGEGSAATFSGITVAAADTTAATRAESQDQPALLHRDGDTWWWQLRGGATRTRPPPMWYLKLKAKNSEGPGQLKKQVLELTARDRKGRGPRQVLAATGRDVPTTTTISPGPTG